MPREIHNVGLLFETPCSNAEKGISEIGTYRLQAATDRRNYRNSMCVIPGGPKIEIRLNFAADVAYVKSDFMFCIRVQFG